jgi:hypothetical protein
MDQPYAVAPRGAWAVADSQWLTLQIAWRFCGLLTQTLMHVTFIAASDSRIASREIPRIGVC